MALGKKTGGRVAGTPNKRTAELADRLAELDVDPVTGLAEIARDPTCSLELRAKVLGDLMSYLFPRRKALDVNAQSQQPVFIRIGLAAKADGAEGRSE